jgi:cell division protein FtsA
MFKIKDSPIGLLDIGSSKIVALIVKFTPEVKILGVSYKKALGIKAGQIVDLEAAQQAIKEAIEEAQKEAGLQMTKVYLGLSFENLSSKTIRYEIKLQDKAISDKVVKNLLLEVLNLCKHEKLEVLHSFACDYTLDNKSVLVNPIGLYGEKLACDFYLIVANLKNLLNMQTTVIKSGLEVGGYIASGYGAGLAVLSNQEREEGVILLDFGAGTTTISVFSEDKLVFLDSLALGGNLITKDIATLLSITFAEAERIKTLYGGVLGTDADRKELVIELEQGQNLFRSDLIEIIQARLEEILEIILPKVELFPYKIVITGGVARTLRLTELMSDFFQRKVVIGITKNLNLLKNPRNELEMSSALGLLKHLENSYNLAIRDKKSEATKKSNLIKWLQETFFAGNSE